MLLLLIAAANAATVRATVAIDGDSARILQAHLLPDDLRVPLAGDGLPIDVIDDKGEVLTRVNLPDARRRSVIYPEGGGATAVLQSAVAVVTLPWPEGAARLRLGAELTVPSAPPPGEAVPVQDSGPEEERLDIVFMGDGYTADQQDDFAADVDRFTGHLLEIEPYGAYTGLFNIWRIDAVSSESGATHYEMDPPVFKDTAYGCYYGCGSIDRLICCSDSAVVGAFEEAVPAADGVVVLVNDETYGGSGSSTYATTYVGEGYGPQVAVHELGHSLIGLWDEYSYGYDGGGGDGPNCAANPEAVPWQQWLDKAAVDAFQVCSYENYYRPTDNACMMNSLQDQYCPVCRELAVRAVYSRLPGLILSTDPVEGEVVMGEDSVFSAVVLGPDAGATVQWTLGTEVLGEATSAEVPGCGSDAVLRLSVRDDTAWVRDDPLGLLQDEATWTLKRQPCEGDTDTGGEVSGKPQAQPGGPRAGNLTSCGCGGGGVMALLPALLALLGAARRRSSTARERQAAAQRRSSTSGER